MKRREKPELIVARPNKERNYTNISIRRKAIRIANTARVNNCDVVKISKGKTPIIMQRIIGNQVEVVVPNQVPIDKLAIQIESRLRGRKNVKIEIDSYEKPRRKRKSVHGYRTHMTTPSILKWSKGDGDDGSGTDDRHGKIRKRRKK